MVVTNTCMGYWVRLSHVLFFIYLDTPEHIQAMRGGRGGVWCRGWLWVKSLGLGSCLRGAVTQ